MIGLTAPTWFVDKARSYMGTRLLGPYGHAVADAFRIIHDEIALPSVRLMRTASGPPPSAAVVGGVLPDGSLQLLGVGIDLGEQLRNAVMTAPFVAVAHARTNDSGIYCLGGQQSPFVSYSLITTGVPSVGSVLSAWANGISNVHAGARERKRELWNPQDALRLTDFDERIHHMEIGQGYANRLAEQVRYRWRQGRRAKPVRIATTLWMNLTGPGWLEQVCNGLIGRVLKGPRDYAIKQAIRIATQEISARNVAERTGAPFAALVLGEHANGKLEIVSGSASCIRLTRNASYHAEFMAIWEAALKSKGKYGLDAAADGFARYILVSTASPCNSCAIAACANGINMVYAGVRQSMVQKVLGFHEAPLKRGALRRLGMIIHDGICQRECMVPYAEFCRSRRADSMTMPLAQRPRHPPRRTI